MVYRLVYCYLRDCRSTLGMAYCVVFVIYVTVNRLAVGRSASFFLLTRLLFYSWGKVILYGALFESGGVLIGRVFLLDE